MPGKVMLSVLLCCSVFVVSGWNSQTGQNPLSEKVSDIKHLVNQSDWEKAKNEADSLEFMYNKKKWLLQFMGDEQEYESLNREIMILSEAINEKDKTQTKIILATIDAILNEIYSL